MKKELEKRIGFIVCLLIITALCISNTMLEVEAAFDDINQSSVFLKQEESDTCTLCAAAMMMRRAAMLRGDANWASITETTIKNTAWLNEAGLLHDFSYDGITVSYGDLPGGIMNTDTLIQLLKSHTEGIVLYDRDTPHAVLLTDYTNGQFYCAEPLQTRGLGRILLSEAYKVSVENADAYWYVTSPSSIATEKTEKSDPVLKFLKSIKKVTGDDDFKLEVKQTEGNGTISFHTSNQAVAEVDETGTVKIKGSGVCVITITVKETEQFNQYVGKTIVMVHPKQSIIRSAAATGKKGIKLKWKKDSDATGYHIQYCTSKKFGKKNTKNLTIGKSTTITKKMNKAFSGKKCYIRIRAYKTVKVDEKKQNLYGKWSTIKAVTRK